MRNGPVRSGSKNPFRSVPSPRVFVPQSPVPSCPRVPVSPVSPCLRVYVSTCLRVPVSLSSYLLNSCLPFTYLHLFLVLHNKYVSSSPSLPSPPFPVSPCPRVPVSPCPNVSVSPCPRVFVPQYPVPSCSLVPLFPCPSVPVSPEPEPEPDFKDGYPARSGFSRNSGWFLDSQRRYMFFDQGEDLEHGSILYHVVTPTVVLLSS